VIFKIEGEDRELKVFIEDMNFFRISGSGKLMVNKCKFKENELCDTSVGEYRGIFCGTLICVEGGDLVIKGNTSLETIHHRFNSFTNWMNLESGMKEGVWTNY
jgi:hypothetical protein